MTSFPDGLQPPVPARVLPTGNASRRRLHQARGAVVGPARSDFAVILIGLCVALFAVAPGLSGAQPPRADGHGEPGRPGESRVYACVDASDPLARRRLQGEPCRLPMYEMPPPAEPALIEAPGLQPPTAPPPGAQAGHAMFWRFPVQGHGPYEVPRHGWR